MKKLVAIVLLLVYGLSSSGMTLQFNYCCGKLKSVKLTPVKDSECGMAHSMGSKKCCDSKQLELKIKADQKLEQSGKFVFSLPLLQKQEHSVAVAHLAAANEIAPEVFAPPPLQKPLFVLFCVYRI
jgi:hypothetical protein